MFWEGSRPEALRNSVFCEVSGPKALRPEAIPKLIRYIKGHTETYSVYQKPYRDLFCISETIPKLFDTSQAIPKLILYIRGHTETYSVYQKPYRNLFCKNHIHKLANANRPYQLDVKIWHYNWSAKLIYTRSIKFGFVFENNLNIHTSAFLLLCRSCWLVSNLPCIVIEGLTHCHIGMP